MKMPHLYTNLLNKLNNKSNIEELYPERYKKKMINLNDILIQHNSIYRKSYIGKIVSPNMVRANSYSVFSKNKLKTIGEFANPINSINILRIKP